MEVSANTNYVIWVPLPGSGVLSPRRRAEVCRGTLAARGAEGGAGGPQNGCPPFLQVGGPEAAGTGGVASVINY